MGQQARVTRADRRAQANSTQPTQQRQHPSGEDRISGRIWIERWTDICIRIRLVPRL